MPGDPFWSNVFRRGPRQENELYDLLGKVPIFADLSRREFEKIEGILHRRNYGVDEYIVKEGDMGVGMYVVLSGEVDIVQKSDTGEVTLATFGPGDFFGDQALLEESPRTASAIARESCRTVGFFRPDLLELIERNPHLGLKIIMRLSQMISVRLRQTNRLLKDARDRATEMERKHREAVEKAQADAATAAAEAGLTSTDSAASTEPDSASGKPGASRESGASVRKSVDTSSETIRVAPSAGQA